MVVKSNSKRLSNTIPKVQLKRKKLHVALLAVGFKNYT